jgi:hypothetical protein
MFMENESVFAVEFNLGRGLVILLALALVATLLAGYMAWDRQDASASEAEAPLASSANMRQYYLTYSSYNGADADTACASGYHMASLWEIVDASNLKYNTDILSYHPNDAGEGPTSTVAAWVRTGSTSSNIATAGRGNCNAWTSSAGTDNGTQMALNSIWTGPANIINIWNATTTTCDSTRRVWCMED